MENRNRVRTEETVRRSNMGLFTRVGLYFVGVFCLMAGPAWAEPKPFSGTGQVTTRFNAETNAVTFARSDSGSSNDLGQYTCTTTGSAASDISGSCGDSAIGFSLTNIRAECTSEDIDYPYTVQYEDTINCIPLACYSPDPPHPLIVGCSYSASYTGTITGGDGVTHGVMGSVTSTDILTARGESNDGVIFVAQYTSAHQGTTDIEFIEEEEPARGIRLGIPAPGSTVNGIGLISGWSCLGGELKAEIIDAGEVVDTVVLNHGSSRTDTEGVCGDIHNGFSATVNWNHYAQGAKTIRLIRNGEEAESNEFSILRLSEDEFLTGASGMCVVNNFPDAGQDTTIEWDESRQGFFPTGIQDSQ